MPHGVQLAKIYEARPPAPSKINVHAKKSAFRFNPTAPSIVQKITKPMHSIKIKNDWNGTRLRNFSSFNKVT